MTSGRILVAEDSTVIRAVISRQLRAAGFEVLEAEDGLQAVAQISERRPDIVLLDIEMPHLDGYGVLAAVKANPEVRDTPVVFLTGRDDVRDMVKGLGLGAHDYLRKPFEPAELMARAQAALRVKALQDDLKNRNDALHSFVTVLVHELRAPLMVISGYLEMLSYGSYGSLPEETNEPLALISGKADEVRTLVDELLLAARLETGEAPIDLMALDLRGEVAAAIDRARPRAELLNATLAQDPVATPVMARADPAHIRRILDNLVNNALNYGGAKPWVKVRLGLGRGKSEKDAWVTVADHGGGIPAEMRERVFQRFVRVREQTAHPGSGLGLYISRQLAERQGGSLTLDPGEPGKGSTFALVLPVSDN